MIRRCELDPSKRDLVLRKMIPSMRVPAHGALGAKWECPYIIKIVLWEGTYHVTDMDGRLIPRAWNAHY